MKKSIIVIVLLLTTHLAFSQLKVGINAGIPVGDVGEFYSFSLGADVYYMFGDQDAFLEFGATAGFLNYFGKEVDIVGQSTDIDNAQFIPLAGAARFTLFGFLRFGPDVGYAIALSDTYDGGFYYRAVLGIDLGDRVELNTFYHSISQEGSNIGSVGAGLLIEFGGS